MSLSSTKRNRRTGAPVPGQHGQGGGIRDLSVVFADRTQHRQAVVAYWEESGAGGAELVVKYVEATPAAFAQAFGPAGGLAPAGMFRTADNAYAARTRVFQRGEDLRAAGDDYVNNLLIEVAADAAGDGATSFFDAGLDQLSCDWARLPDDEVAVTDLPREHVDFAAAQLRAWLDGGSGAPAAAAAGPALRLGVETTLRAVLRYHLAASASAASAAVSPEGIEGGAATALLAVGTEGFAYGLWSAERGLLRELHEQFLGAGPDEAEYDAAGLDEGTIAALREAAIGHAISRLAGLIRDAQSKHGFERVARVVFAAAPNTHEDAHAALLRYTQAAGLAVVELPVPLEEAVAQGLALGAGDSIVPTINLAGDLRHRADEALRLESQTVAAAAAARRAGTLCAMLAAFVLAFAFVIGSYVAAKFQSFSLARAQQQEVAEQARLRPIAQERKSAVENIKWFQTAVSQTLDRRSKQAGTVRLFDDLNDRWRAVAADDNTWYVKELTVSPAGALEIKGLTKREESVTAFSRSLEFSSGLFTNAYPQVTSGVPLTAAGGVGLPTGLPQNVANNLAPGVTSWTVKAVYTPLASGAPKAATAAAQPAPQTPAPTGATK